jgi:hypothetical protein
MLPYRDSRVTKTALVIFFIVILGYGYYEARGLLFGPVISVTSSVSVVYEPFIVIRGKADRISSLSMNGKIIPVTEDGIFEEPFVLAPGNNHIMLDAVDKYGRTRQEVIEIVYAPPTLPVVLAPSNTSTSTLQ